MKKSKPFLLAIIGKSDSGKTTLILKLLPFLRRRGHQVAVAKHCPCGFDLDIEGKDSWRFTQARSKGIYLSSGHDETVLRPIPPRQNLTKRLKNYFSDFDIVLLEGYNNEPKIKKIQIVRKKIGGKLLNQQEVVAYISDMKINTRKPVLKIDNALKIISFIEKLIKKQKGRQ